MSLSEMEGGKNDDLAYVQVSAVSVAHLGVCARIIGRMGDPPRPKPTCTLGNRSFSWMFRINIEFESRLISTG